MSDLRPDVEFIVFVIRDEFGSSVKNGDEVSMRNLVKKTSNPMRVGGIDDDIAVEQLRKAGMLLVFLDYASVLCLCGEPRVRRRPLRDFLCHLDLRLTDIISL